MASLKKVQIHHQNDHEPLNNGTGNLQPFVGVYDPACGSGGFFLAGLGRLQTGPSQPPRA